MDLFADLRHNRGILNLISQPLLCFDPYFSCKRIGPSEGVIKHRCSLQEF